MNWHPILIVSAQVTAVAALGLLSARLLRSAAHRHSVLFASLLCILGSPLFFAGVAGIGLSFPLPAVFPAPREDVAATPLPHDFAPNRQGDNLPALPEPTEFPTTGVPDSHAAVPPIAPAESVQQQHDQVDGIALRADHVLAGLWLAGTVLSLAGLLRSQLKTQAILKSAHPVGKGIDANIIAETERRLGAVRSLRIATTGKVAGPAVIGIVEPWILIPVRYLETLSGDELRQVLIHEGAHALRRDPLAALLQRIGGALFWWHPLVHLVNRDLTRAREEVCDNFVLTYTEPEIYGATLLRIATLSPAMARLPFAIGMFDGRGKLEDRIRGLLDARRRILTHVRFATAAAAVGALALLSVVVASARVVAQHPDDAPPIAIPVAEKVTDAPLTEAVDVNDFRLVLSYHGESDKPFYALTLKVPQDGAQQPHEFFLTQQISQGQAGKLTKHLKDSQFFEHARVTENQNDPTTGNPQYLLRVHLGGRYFEETLGWDVGTIARLDGLRKTLDGEAATLMEKLLARLEGQRNVWESGEVINDLQTTLSTEKETYSAGLPIPIKLELTNVGQQAQDYGHHRFILSGSEIVVTDEHGRQVPYLGGGAGLTRRETTIKPGETKLIESCDLSDFYYLRRPGLYTLSFRQVAVYDAGVPSSNVVRFRVIADTAAAADGDPMGKLLPLVSANFGLIGSPNAGGKVRPGRNRQESPGRQYIFVGPGGLKVSQATVWLWLTDEVAEDAEPAENDYLPTSEYLGNVSRWHLYLHAPPEALNLWPTVEHDLKTALTNANGT